MLFESFNKDCLIITIKWALHHCLYDDILDTIWITNKKLLHFKLSKSGQILRIDKTGFSKPIHINYIFNKYI